jgi:hypothetical protein
VGGEVVCVLHFGVRRAKQDEEGHSGELVCVHAEGVVVLEITELGLGREDRPPSGRLLRYYFSLTHQKSVSVVDNLQLELRIVKIVLVFS